MIEVPELMVLKQNLGKRFLGKALQDFRIHSVGKSKEPKNLVEAAAIGATLTGIERVGKFLHLIFDNGQTIGFYLGTKGIPYLPPSDRLASGKEFEMIFSNGSGFGIHDHTRQTRISLNPNALKTPDILSSELTLDYLKNILIQSKKELIKPLLTNPYKIVGLGNAYVDEILWNVGVSPLSLASKVPQSKIAELFSAIQAVLHSATNLISEHTKPDELLCDSRLFLTIHNPRRKLCPNGFPIQKGIVKGVATYWTESQVVYK